MTLEFMRSEQISNEDYYNSPGLSQSQLKELKKSPRHFWAKHIAKIVPNEETEALRLGTAVHLCISDYDKFLKEYVSIPKINKQTKEGKLNYKLFLEQNVGKILMEEDDYAMTMSMRSSLNSKRCAEHLFRAEGISESPLYWSDPITGVMCKALPDHQILPCATFPNGAILDYKTTKSADAATFAKSIDNFGYYNQAAWYCWGFRKNYNTPGLPLFIFVAIEKAIPYECAFYTADATIIELGTKENRQLLDLYSNCLQSDNWYGYPDQLEQISLPIWAINRLR